MHGGQTDRQTDRSLSADAAAAVFIWPESRPSKERVFLHIFPPLTISQLVSQQASS